MRPKVASALQPPWEPLAFPQLQAQAQQEVGPRVRMQASAAAAAVPRFRPEPGAAAREAAARVLRAAPALSAARRTQPAFCSTNTASPARARPLRGARAAPR